MNEQYEKLRQVIIAANPEIVELKEPENWWITKMEIATIVKDTIGDSYQKRFNEHLDYFQWVGIRENMESCASQIDQKIFDMLSLTRASIGRPIRLADVLLAMPDGIFISSSGWFQQANGGPVTAMQDKYVRWNLRNDDLDWHYHNKPETVQFLIDLLVKGS